MAPDSSERQQMTATQLETTKTYENGSMYGSEIVVEEVEVVSKLVALNHTARMVSFFPSYLEITNSSLVSTSATFGAKNGTIS